MTEQNRMLTAALYYARFGWQVFPLVPRGKVPMTAHGFMDATTDAAQIIEWWTKRPDANIGIATGERSGLFVVDIDGPAGEATLARLGWKVDRCVMAKTGLGFHLFFRHQPGLNNTAGIIGREGDSKERTGIDSRGDGGYVVAAPSIHPNGTEYRWERGLQDAPLGSLPLPILAEYERAVASVKPKKKKPTEAVV